MARAARGALEPQCWMVIFAGAGSFCLLLFAMIGMALNYEQPPKPETRTP
eukprot:SAG31_NODE_17939_length_652_cov_1.121157_1_plen_49_part_01